MKILSISPNYAKRWNSAHELLRNSLYAGHNVIQWGPGHENFDPCIPLTELTRNVDIVFIHHSKHIRVWAKDLNKIKIKKVCFQIDYFPEREEWRDNFLITTGLDLIVFPNRFQIDWFRARNGARTSPVTFYLPFGVDTRVFQPRVLDKTIDVFSAMSINPTEYPNREAVNSVLGEFPNSVVYNIHPLMCLPLPISDYVAHMQSSLVCANSLDRYGSVSLRCFEALACRSVLFTDIPKDFERLGFRDGENFVAYTPHPVDIKIKLTQLLSDPERLDHIASNGFNFVRGFHTNEIRAERFWTFLRGLL